MQWGTHAYQDLKALVIMTTSHSTQTGGMHFNISGFINMYRYKLQAHKQLSWLLLMIKLKSCLQIKVSSFKLEGLNVNDFAFAGEI